MTGDPSPFALWNDAIGYVARNVSNMESWSAQACECELCRGRRYFHFDLNQSCLNPDATPNRLLGAVVNERGEAI